MQVVHSNMRYENYDREGRCLDCCAQYYCLTKLIQPASKELYVYMTDALNDVVVDIDELLYIFANIPWILTSRNKREGLSAVCLDRPHCCLLPSWCHDVCTTSHACHNHCSSQTLHSV